MEFKWAGFTSYVSTKGLRTDKTFDPSLGLSLLISYINHPFMLPNSSSMSSSILLFPSYVVSSTFKYSWKLAKGGREAVSEESAYSLSEGASKPDGYCCITKTSLGILSPLLPKS